MPGCEPQMILLYMFIEVYTGSHKINMAEASVQELVCRRTRKDKLGMDKSKVQVHQKQGYGTLTRICTSAMEGC